VSDSSEVTAAKDLLTPECGLDSAAAE